MLKNTAASSCIFITLASTQFLTDSRTTDPGRHAEASAVEFLKREVPAWSRNNRCFSCHNNGDAARALYAAHRKGYRIPANVLAETTAWLAQPHRWDENKGDPRFSDKRLANIQFAAALQAALEAGHLTDTRPLQAAARKVANDQSSDGAWPVDTGATLGSPATYGTTLATTLASRVLKAATAPETVDALQRAERWLRQAPANSVSAAAVLLLASAGDSGQAVRIRQEEYLKTILRAQTRDGGWGPYADSPPEPFDTAMVLLALAETRSQGGVSNRIRRGRNFLAAQQDSDGGWPATTRPAGGDSYAQRLSTTGWVTLALLATRE
ncbi:MAG: hypothetical protein L0387_04315 [Acidobacteria bacterium]|nr:hypothetical protein [Acidobacteriota bacterium]